MVNEWEFPQQTEQFSLITGILEIHLFTVEMLVLSQQTGVKKKLNLAMQLLLLEEKLVAMAFMAQRFHRLNLMIRLKTLEVSSKLAIQSWRKRLQMC